MSNVQDAHRSVDHAKTKQHTRNRCMSLSRMMQTMRHMKTQQQQQQQLYTWCGLIANLFVHQCRDDQDDKDIEARKHAAAAAPTACCHFVGMYTLQNNISKAKMTV